ncbi:MAG: ABC transporter ATP-binding protein, partial [Anaerolineae bacterium]
MSLLQARDVTKRFGGLTAVNSFSMDIPERSIISLIGPNGAGKTTFFNCVTGFYTPDEGEIVFDGERLTWLKVDRIANAGIERTYQNIRLFENMTVIENVMVGQHSRLNTGVFATLAIRPAEEENRQATKRARDLLAFVGLKG